MALSLRAAPEEKASMAKKNTRNNSKAAGETAVPLSAFLPTTRAEADARGWGQLDFVYVSGQSSYICKQNLKLLVKRSLSARQ